MRHTFEAKEYLQRYLQHLSDSVGASDSDVEIQRGDIRRFLNFLASDQSLTDARQIGPHHVSLFAASLTDCRGSCIRRHLQTLSSFFRFLEDTPSVPARSIGKTVAHQPAERETFADAFARYLEHAEAYRGLRPKTIDAYERDGARFGDFLEENGLAQNVRQITSRDVQAWANSMAGYAPSTIRRRIYAIRGFFSFLQREGTIQVNPAADVALPKRRGKQPPVPNQQQCQKLLASAHTPKERAIISLLVMGGLRRSELLGLNAEDVADDWSEVRVIGKGDVERLLPLPDEARAALVRHIETDGIPSGPLFLNQAGNRMGNTTLQRFWKRLLRRADLADESFTIHSCRHAYATMLVRNGTDIRTVQELLGHADLSTTATYLHSDLRTKRKAVANLPIGESAFGGGGR